jgi:hypothetical protein
MSSKPGAYWRRCCGCSGLGSMPQLRSSDRRPGWSNRKANRPYSGHSAAEALGPLKCSEATRSGKATGSSKVTRACKASWCFRFSPCCSCCCCCVL